MSRATLIIALGIGFMLGGLALLVFALRQKIVPEGTKAPRKSDLQKIEIEKQNNVKLRIGGGVIAAFGAVLALLAALS